MFEIEAKGDSIRLAGRLDAAVADKADAVLGQITESAVVDFSDLAYISSAGLGVLFAAQKRLLAEGKGLRLIHLNPHIREVFEIAGFDSVFEIGDSASPQVEPSPAPAIDDRPPERGHKRRWKGLRRLFGGGRTEPRDGNE